MVGGRTGTHQSEPNFFPDHSAAGFAGLIYGHCPKGGQFHWQVLTAEIIILD